MKYSLILVSATVVYGLALPEVDTEGIAKRGDKEGWGILKDCHQQECGKLFFKEPTEAQKKEYDGYVVSVLALVPANTVTATRSGTGSSTSRVTRLTTTTTTPMMSTTSE